METPVSARVNVPRPQVSPRSEQAGETRAKLTVRDLNFFYGSYHALKSISLEVPERRVTAIIGPSGCGKSTLLRTFNRMYSLYPEQRAEGEIIMDGENLLTVKRDVSLIRAKIGMVFQKPTPFPMSIYCHRQEPAPAPCQADSRR